MNIPKIRLKLLGAESDELPEVWQGRAFDVECGIFIDESTSESDFGNVTSATFYVTRDRSEGSTLISSEVLIDDFDNDGSIDLPDWEDGSVQHVTFSIADASANIAITDADERLWWTVKATLTTGTKTLGAGYIIFREDAGSGDPAPPLDQYYTKEEVDGLITGGGVTDHGALTGLADDDHTQYHNNTRGDARYLQSSTLGSGVATFLATPSSANLAAAVTGETGTGALVFANGATLTNLTANGTITGSFEGALGDDTTFDNAPVTLANLGAAAASHTHVSVDVTDASSGALDNSQAGKLAKFSVDGDLAMASLTVGGIDATGVFSSDWVSATNYVQSPSFTFPNSAASIIADVDATGTHKLTGPGGDILTNQTGLVAVNNLIDVSDPLAARSNLGLGSMATQAASAVNISGGTITGITPIAVPYGGTGTGALTGIIKGNGASAHTAVTAPSGAIVGTTDAQTLTNKSIDAGQLTGNVVVARIATALTTPGAIGATTPSTGAFTTLSASSTVSGAGFTAYMASPPAIGGTAAAAITGTTVATTGNGASMASPSPTTGAWFTGGNSTTTKPQVLIEPAGTTSTGWSTAGTGLGINAASGFTGSLFDAQMAGASKFKVLSSGSVMINGTAGSIDITQGGNGGIVMRGATPKMTWNGYFAIQGTATDVMTILGDSGTSPRICIGGISTDFPAIVRNLTAINLTLGDGTGNAPLTCGALAVTGEAAATTHVRCGGTAAHYWSGRCEMYSTSTTINFKTAGQAGNASISVADVTASGKYVGSVNSVTASGTIATVSTATHVTEVTSTTVGGVLSFGDGVPGQQKIVVHGVDGGSAILTPTTATGWTTYTMTNAGDSISMIFLATRGWIILATNGGTIA